MSMTCYAAKLDTAGRCFSPSHGNVEDKMSLANGNAFAMIDAMGLEVNDGDSFHCKLETFIVACAKLLMSEKALDPYVNRRATAMIEEARVGALHGATHFVMA